CGGGGGGERGTACGWPAAGHPGPADRPARCAETTHDAGATRCQALAADRQPVRTAPDPSASPCGSTPTASTRTGRAAVLAIASGPANMRPIGAAGVTATAIA